MKTCNALALAAACALWMQVSCSSSKPTDSPAGAVGGPLPGDRDVHCSGVAPVQIEPAACTNPGSEAAEGGAHGSSGAAGSGGSDCNQTHDAEYGDTLPNSEGDDDDCKLHVAWSSTPVRLNQNVTFTVEATRLADGQPLQALDDGKLPLSRVEVYQPCEPTRRGPAQNAAAKFNQTAAGTYSAGPLVFDQPGRWVVRFHFYEQCLDGEASPHAHIAFFIDVPRAS